MIFCYHQLPPLNSTLGTQRLARLIPNATLSASFPWHFLVWSRSTRSQKTWGKTRGLAVSVETPDFLDFFEAGNFWPDALWTLEWTYTDTVWTVQCDNSCNLVFRRISTNIFWYHLLFLGIFTVNNKHVSSQLSISMNMLVIWWQEKSREFLDFGRLSDTKMAEKGWAADGICPHPISTNRRVLLGKWKKPGL